MSNWIPVFTLPNVFVKDPIEVEYVALVSPEDPRCKAIGKTNKNFLKFLRSFTDAFQAQGGSECDSLTRRRSPVGQVL
jgi:hypothetical protein